MQPIAHDFVELSPELQTLAKLSWTLWQREQDSNSDLPDYSFVVFPLAKAYEGMLKEYLLAMKLIDRATFESRRFRIGRALNPDLHPDQQTDHWLYDDVARECGETLARQIWDAWLTCRNHIFHYFPEKNANLSLQQAHKCLTILTTTIQAVSACQHQSRK